MGLRSKKGNPTKKPWRVKTTSQRIVDAFKDKTCSCGHPHEICEGTETARSAMYPPPDDSFDHPSGCTLPNALNSMPQRSIER